MATLEDKSVDAVIADPPYGTTACKWDNVIPFEPMWKQLKRVIKPKGAIVLFGSEPFSSRLRMSNLKGFKYDWIWDKGRAANIFNVNIAPLKVHEIVSVFNSGSFYPIKRDGTPRTDKYTTKKSDMYGGGKNIVDYSNDGTQYNPVSILFAAGEHNKKTVHPTQKPVKLMSYLVRTYTLEGETVLDFTMGSGSTGCAAVMDNRNFIGCELDRGYFEIAEERIYQATRQQRLF